MAHYLELDGVDDNLSIPSITFDEVIMDFNLIPMAEAGDQYYIDARVGIGNSYLFYRPSTQKDLTSAGSPWMTGNGKVFVDGVQRTDPTNVNIPKEQHVELHLILDAPGADDIRVFSNNSGGNRAQVRVYSIKFMSGGSVVAHYDMTTQTVQDQSGNGNHATLTGGTWVDDGTGGETGMDVSYTYGTAQTITVDRSSTFATVQRVYADRLDQYPTSQTIFADRSDSLATEQVIYADRVYNYPMEQVLYSDFVPFSASFPLSISIYADRATEAPTEQVWTDERSYSFGMVQQIYKQQAMQAPTAQIIYNDTLALFPMRQSLYADKTYSNPTTVFMYDPSGEIKGAITLVGNRELTLTLESSKELIIELRGGVVTAKNQDFEMFAGDSKKIVVSVTNSDGSALDLTGSTIKWALIQQYPITKQLVLKTIGSGLTLTSEAFTISMEPSDTAGLKGGYYHEAELTDPLSNVSTILTGKASILASLV